jgi:hypothetical protein
MKRPTRLSHAQRRVRLAAAKLAQQLALVPRGTCAGCGARLSVADTDGLCVSCADPICKVSL